MVAIATILFAFPIGLFVRQRLTAWFAYAALFLWLYTFQTAELTRAWVLGDDTAFARTPGAGPALDYGLVTGGVFVVGIALVALGHRVAARRRARRGTADLDPTGRP